MPSAGFLIYSGIIPLLETYITIIVGYGMAKTGLFPASALKGTSQVTMSLSLPCLIFASVVPAFTPTNVSAIGPLFLLAFIYTVLGWISGLIIREVCYVPRNFWRGIVVLCAVSNWGNLPNAIILSITKQKPFNPSTDQALGVSFVSIFLVAFVIAFFPCGLCRSIAWDYAPGVPQGIDAERRVSWREKPFGSKIYRVLGIGSSRRRGSSDVVEEGKSTSDGRDLEQNQPREDEKVDPPSTQDHSSSLEDHKPPSSPSPPSKYLTQRILTGTNYILQTVILNPGAFALIVSLPIALIPQLKALFVDASANGGPGLKGPDGRPPLAFVIDTASSVGGITVPMGLILLGSSFARFKLPRPLSRLPLLAILTACLAKMVVIPVIGIFTVQSMTRTGFIDKQDKVERFVAMLVSGTPAAVFQVIVAQIHAPDGEIDTLAAFLLAQYVFMFFSTAAISAVALSLL